MLKYFPIIITAVFLLSSNVYTTDVTTSQEHLTLQNKLNQAVATLAQRNPPMIVGVADPNGQLLLAELGYLKDDGIPPEEALIDLNSITKTITAAMVMKLVEEGQIALEDHLGKFWNFNSDKAKSTVHQLLTHSAGLRESLGDDFTQLSREAFLALVDKNRLKNKPGTVYHYSNTGYSLLAALIEIVSGKTYEAYLNQNLLQAIDVRMGYGSVYQPERAIKTRKGKTIFQDSWGGHGPSWHLIGNGGLVTSVPEFIRFYQALLSGDILSQSSIDLMHQKQIIEDNGNSHYGYGLVVEDHPQGPVYWHDGGNDIFSAEWRYIKKRGIILMTAGADSRKGTASDAMDVIVEQIFSRQ